MFCTKCGKELYPGDRFCAYCGAEVRNHEKPRYEDIVFNPPFKIEAEKKTQEILQAVAQPQEAPTPKQAASVAFDWELEDTPRRKSQKTDDVDFNWESVLERRNLSRTQEINIEKIRTAQLEAESGLSFAPREEKKPASAEPAPQAEAYRAAQAPAAMNRSVRDEKLNDEDAQSIEDLERELFGALQPAQDRPAGTAVPAPVRPAGPQPGSAQELTRTKISLPQAERQAAEHAALQRRAAENVMPQSVQASQGQAENDAAAQASTQGMEDHAAGSAAAQCMQESPGRIAESGAQDAAPPRDERFYTYHQKTDAFDALLEQERERMRAMQEEYGRSARNMDYTWVPEVFPQKSEAQQVPVQASGAQIAPQGTRQSQTADVQTAQQGKTQDGAAQQAQAKQEAGVQTVQQPVDAADPRVSVEVVQPTTPKTIDLTVSIQIPEAAEPEGEAVQTSLPPSQTKLRYSDVFPRVDVADNAGGADSAGTGAAAEAGKKEITLPDIDDDEEEPKKHIFARIIITLLIILIVVEGVILGIKFFAPDSAVSLKINELLTAAIDIFSGQKPSDDADDPQQTDVNTAETYYTQLVSAAAADTTTIGQVQYDAALCYDKNKTYAFAEIPDTADFDDRSWITDKDGNAVTYAQSLLGAVVDYYDGWQATNKDDALVGINLLEIGEIRVGTEGFYVLCRVTYAGADGKDVVQYQSVYTRTSQDTMVIDTVKEENI